MVCLIWGVMSLVANVSGVPDHDWEGPVSWSSMTKIEETSVHTVGWSYPLLATPSPNIVCPWGVGHRGPYDKPVLLPYMED